MTAREAETVKLKQLQLILQLFSYHPHAVASSLHLKCVAKDHRILLTEMPQTIYPTIFFSQHVPHAIFSMHRKIIYSVVDVSITTLAMVLMFFPDLEFFPCDRCQINSIALSERLWLTIMDELVIYKFRTIQKPR